MTIIENHKHTFQVDDLGQWDLDEDRSIVPSIQNALNFYNQTCASGAALARPCLWQNDLYVME